MTLALAPQPQFDAWWNEPHWCDPDLCYGGAVEVDGDTIQTHRLHQRRLANLDCADDDSRNAAVTVTVAVERADSIDEIGPTDMVLRVGDSGANLTREQRRQLIFALLAVDDLGIEESA